MLKIYNTFTRELEAFKPINEGEVMMYVCGPTVYNYIHIGNARSAIAFDVVRRYLEYRGYKVNFVSNFTDVDDKIINRAKELGTTASNVAETYIKAYFEDTGALNVKKACCNPRVVDHIDDIISFIEVLISKGYAYESAGDVYYRTTKFADYGHLANKTIEELESGASGRVDAADLKEDPLDFALWKSAKVDEVSWDSPWGAGRPGWHIECSVMATKHLADTIDIHGGGQDLEFPHHENEIAQSEAKTGVKFANYWMHNGFVTVGDNDEKMSKSLGNFKTVHEMIEIIDPKVLRLMMASAHYRRPIRFSDATIQEATANYEKLKNALANLDFKLTTDLVDATDNRHLQVLSEIENEFVTAMDDDINAANGISVIYELTKFINTLDASREVFEKARALFLSLTEVFGISFEEESDDLAAEIEALIEERQLARKNKDFARSDEIRDDLSARGIILEDTPDGVRWKKS
ncbi:MAG: cysteine--tRNA ligase [Lactobacillales bacterium]|jgi:cysteinyl-tRNA synthetase|nr:cysteine--tRNA ligase [Lactobacillales bacterium]